MEKEESSLSGDRTDSQVKDKGKGKESLADTTSIEQDHNAGSGASEATQSADVSVMSRLASSAMALGNSLLLGPSMANQIAPPDKAGSAANSNLQSLRGEASTYRAQENTGHGSSLRSAHVQDHINQEEVAFSQFLEGTDISVSSDYDAGAVPGGTFGGVSNQTLQTYQHPHYSSHLETDGSEVVKLLDSGYEEVLHTTPETPLSREEESSLRQALFGADGDRSGGRANIQDWASLLNFVPEYISNGSSGWGYKELTQHLGTSDAQEASKIWADAWGDVLSHYTDEVWGDLGPLVKEAREEARKIQDSGREATPSEAKAILRLRQILAHVRRDG